MSPSSNGLVEKPPHDFLVVLDVHTSLLVAVMRVVLPCATFLQCTQVATADGRRFDRCADVPAVW
jgi:hypothetical protein